MLATPIVLAVCAAVLCGCAAGRDNDDRWEHLGASPSLDGGGGAGGIPWSGPDTGGAPPFSCHPEAASCSAGELLHRAYGGCSGPAVCVPRPLECPAVDDPVCACDGTLFSNACEANMAGVDAFHWSVCPPPPATFYCGASLACARGAEYCEIINGDASCQPLPAGCLQPEADGSCLEPVLCFAAPGAPWCDENAAGDFTVTCQITR